MSNLYEGEGRWGGKSIIMYKSTGMKHISVSETVYGTFSVMPRKCLLIQKSKHSVMSYRHRDMYYQYINTSNTIIHYQI